MNQRLPSINSFLQFHPQPQPSQLPPKLDSFFIRIQPKLKGNQLELFSSSEDSTDSTDFRDFLLISEFIHLFFPFIKYFNDSSDSKEEEEEEEEEELKWFHILVALLSTREYGFYTLLVVPLLKFILMERYQYKSFTTLFSGTVQSDNVPYDSSSVSVTEYTTKFLLQKTMQQKFFTVTTTEDRISLLLEMISVISNESLKFKEYIDSLYAKEKELRKMAKTESSQIQQELQRMEGHLSEQEEFIEKWKELRRIDKSIPRAAINYILSSSSSNHTNSNSNSNSSTDLDFSAECLLRYKVFLQNRTLGVDCEGREYFLFSSIPGLFVFDRNGELYVITESSELQLFLKVLKDFPLKSNLQASCVDNEMICGKREQFSVQLSGESDIAVVDYRGKCERVLKDLVQKGSIYGSIGIEEEGGEGRGDVVDVIGKLIKVEEQDKESDNDGLKERKKKKTTRSGSSNKKKKETASAASVNMSIMEKIYFYYSEDNEEDRRESSRIDLNELLKMRKAFNNFYLCLKDNKDDLEVVCYLLCLLEDTILG